MDCTPTLYFVCRRDFIHDVHRFTMMESTWPIPMPPSTVNQLPEPDRNFVYVIEHLFSAQDDVGTLVNVERILISKSRTKGYSHNLLYSLDINENKVYSEKPLDSDSWKVNIMEFVFLNIFFNSHLFRTK